MTLIPATRAIDNVTEYVNPAMICRMQQVSVPAGTFTLIVWPGGEKVSYREAMEHFDGGKQSTRARSGGEIHPDP